MRSANNIDHYFYCWRYFASIFLWCVLLLLLLLLLSSSMWSKRGACSSCFVLQKSICEAYTQLAAEKNDKQCDENVVLWFYGESEMRKIQKSLSHQSLLWTNKLQSFFLTLSFPKKLKLKRGYISSVVRCRIISLSLSLSLSLCVCVARYTNKGQWVWTTIPRKGSRWKSFNEKRRNSKLSRDFRI